jgi:5-hydroxyisourate hydrolase
MSVSTHVLDASVGAPAAGVAIRLECLDAAGWVRLESGITDADGRYRFRAGCQAGTCRLVFATGEYFAGRGVATFYPEVTVTFSAGSAASADGHVHVPLLLSPFAYSTYRGS